MICITGTPGVGKSAVMNELARRGYAVAEFDSLIGDCVVGETGNEKIVDEECLGMIRKDGIYFGHLSHYARCDTVVVLRCHLRSLQERLMKRGYSSAKVMDNVESEAIDSIGSEAEEFHPGNVFEVLNSNVKETADFIEKIIKGKRPSTVKIDLVEEILDWY